MSNTFITLISRDAGLITVPSILEQRRITRESNSILGIRTDNNSPPYMCSFLIHVPVLLSLLLDWLLVFFVCEAHKER